MRLAKYLAHAGVASRRRSETLIASGVVTVGGEVVTDPARDVDEKSGVAVEGEPVKPEPREVWILNKPLDVVSTAREPGKRQAVTDLVPSRRRLYPVGRLDADSTGLILLTNDGELANRLTHPRYGVERTYRATLRKPPTEAQIARLRKGVKLEDGPTRHGEGAALRKARNRDHAARGPQPPDPPDGRGRRQRGRLAQAHPVRLAGARSPARRRRSQARRRSGGGALEGCGSR